MSSLVPSELSNDEFEQILAAAKMGTTPTVVDPFMGSGSTLIAAKRWNYAAVGCEIDERYCEIAADRLRQSVMEFKE